MSAAAKPAPVTPKSLPDAAGHFGQYGGIYVPETLMTARDATGATWRLSTAWTFPLSSCPPDRIEVIGERGSVEMEDGSPIRVYGVAPREVSPPANDLLAAELGYFRDCIRERRRPAIVTLDEAITGLAAADAVLASLKSGGLVRA